jgi:hypothetical protein
MAELLSSTVSRNLVGFSHCLRVAGSRGFMKRLFLFLGSTVKSKKSGGLSQRCTRALPYPTSCWWPYQRKCHFGFFGQVHSNALVMVYNNFLVKEGLYGSPLDWSNDNYGNLTTKATWFHNLWILVQRFNAVLMFCAKDRVQGLWGNNHSLMSEFFQVGHCGKDLISLNTCLKALLQYSVLWDF